MAGPLFVKLVKIKSVVYHKKRVGKPDTAIFDNFISSCISIRIVKL